MFYYIFSLSLRSGDGMGAYMTYLVTTKTTLPSFKEPEVFVRRRFSDFLGLYYRLSEKFMCMGYIVPPAPEKSVSGNDASSFYDIHIVHIFMMICMYFSLGMTKIKFSKNEENSALFIQRRRANLERYKIKWKSSLYLYFFFLFY